MDLILRCSFRFVRVYSLTHRLTFSIEWGILIGMTLIAKNVEARTFTFFYGYLVIVTYLIEVIKNKITK